MDVLDFAVPPLRSHLSDATWEQVSKLAHRVSYKDGQALHARGDAPGGLCLIASGAVKFGRFSRGGAFNLLIMLGPGGHFGDIAAFLGSSRGNNAYAVGHTEIDVFDEHVLDDLLILQPVFARALNRANATRLMGLMELYDDMRTLAVTERLAKVLWYHAGRGEIADGVACLQRDLADVLGVSQMAISKSLKQLENAGLIETGYRCVRIRNKSRLEVWLRKAGAL